MSAEYIVKEGNRDVILCERGIRTFETATRNTLDVSAVPVIKLASHLPVVVDPSHSAGRLDLVLPLSLAGVAAGADGVLVETHPNPEHALCDGPQSLPTAVFGEYAGPRARPGALDGQDRLRPWPRQHVSTVALIGVGLMGGSLGLAARERAGVADVRGFSQTQATLDLALERGAITSACGSLEEACAGADLIFVCTPVRLVVKHVRAALAAAPPHAVVTRRREHQGAADAGALARRAAALHRRAPALRLGDRRRRQRARLAVPGRHLLRDARAPTWTPTPTSCCTGSSATSAPARSPSTPRSTTARWPWSATCRTCWPTCS